jgi:hypothetical protein
VLRTELRISTEFASASRDSLKTILEFVCPATRAVLNVQDLIETVVRLVYLLIPYWFLKRIVVSASILLRLI